MTLTIKLKSQLSNFDMGRIVSHANISHCPISGYQTIC